MYTDINEKLVHVRAVLKKKLKWQNQLADYDMELIAIENEIERLEEQLISEQKDVRKLERIGITNLIQTFFGSKHEKLREEKQEVVAVQIQLEEALKTRDEINDAMGELYDHMEQVLEVEQDYDFLLKEKEKLIKGRDSTFAQQLFGLSEREGDVASYITELHEAIGAGEQVSDALNDAIASLESAEGWGTFDMFGGGVISGLVKHDHIDKATSYVHHAQTSMRKFQKELLDVEEESNLQIDISGMLKFADFFFDGFLVDWMVQGRIRDSLEQVREQYSAVSDVLQRLRTSLEEKERELTDVRVEKRALVEGV